MVSKKLQRRMHALLKDRFSVPGKNPLHLTVRVLFEISLEDDAVISIEALALANSIFFDALTALNSDAPLSELIGRPEVRDLSQEYSCGRSNLLRADRTRERTQQ
jgi:hypothetical protein